MDTPIFDFISTYVNSSTARLHMPGHKGVEFLGVERYDITEIKGADELYNPKGILMESENNASSLFKTAHTFLAVIKFNLFCRKHKAFYACYHRFKKGNNTS